MYNLTNKAFSSQVPTLPEGRAFFRGGSSARRQPQVRKGACSATGVLSLSEPIIRRIVLRTKAEVLNLRQSSFQADITSGFILFPEAIKLSQTALQSLPPSIREDTAARVGGDLGALPCAASGRAFGAWGSWRAVLSVLRTQWKSLRSLGILARCPQCRAHPVKEPSEP